MVDNRVVVGIAGPTRSAAAVEAAARLATVTGRALVVVTAWTDTGQGSSTRRHTGVRSDGSARARAQRLLHAAVDDLPSDLEVETHAVYGAAGPALVQMAGLADDLIVLGLSPRRRFGRPSGGAVGRYCLDHARCPVLMVPEPGPRRRTGGDTLAARVDVVESAGLRARSGSPSRAR